MWVASTAALLAFGATSASAQTGAELDEVVVTARKVEENLQDVPVAVTAETGARLIQQGIDEPSDLTRIVPSLVIPQSTNNVANTLQIRIRGQNAPDNLLTLSQPVGVYVDGVNVPHPVGANGAFFDLDRVEVLKGPQGTLYGRNTTGGAINIITRGADFDGLHGFVAGDVTNYRGVKLGGAVNVPLADDLLALRLAYQQWTRRGYGQSRITGHRAGGDRDDRTFRLSVNFTPSDTLTVIGKVEVGSADRDGNLLTVQALNSAATQAIVVEANAVEGAPNGLNRLLSCVGGDIFSTCSGSETFDNVDTRHAALDIGWDISEGVRLRSVTGYHWFRRFAWFDLDGTPYQAGESSAGIGGFQPYVGVARPPATARLPNGAVPSAGPYAFPWEIRPDQEAGQWTQEFNLSGTAMQDRLSWLLGAFYSDESGEGVQISLRNPATNVLSAAPGLYAPSPNAFEGLDVTTRTWAVFTQNDFDITDMVSVTLGLRYTEEKLGQLNAGWRYSQNFEFSNTALSGAGQNYQCIYGPKAASAAADAFGPARGDDFQADYRDCAVRQDEKFDGTSYLASLNFRPTEDILAYLKISRGYRGGALQLRAPEVPAVRPETADDLEAGFKGTFLANRLRANLAAYRTDYKNAQFSFVEVLGNGVRTTVLRNAAAVKMTGFEAESRLVVAEGLSLGGALTYLDARFKTFPNAPSSIGAVNAAGVRIEVPQWSWMLTGRYETEMAGNQLGLQADLSHAGRIPLTVLSAEPGVDDAIERRMRQPIDLLNARVDYTFTDSGVTLGLFATNLLNKQYAQHSSSTGVGINQSGNGGVYAAIVREPRIWGASLRMTFGGG